jgi:nucleoside 2-deoxyribosyltransferase
MFPVMLAAPSDLEEELKVMREVVLTWSSVHSRSREVALLPVDYMQDAYPEVRERPQNAVNRQLLDKCDILIAAFWTRLGTPTGTSKSGTVEEIERHVAAGRPAMLYFSNANPTLASIDAGQLEAVRAFKNSMQGQSFYREFVSPNDLRTKLTSDLARLMNENEYVRTQLMPHRAPEPQVMDADHDLSEMSKRVLATAARAPDDEEGRVLVSRFESGTCLSAGRKTIVPSVTGRREAEIEAVIKELEMHGLVSTQDSRRQAFVLTKRGYDVADDLPAGYAE